MPQICQHSLRALGVIRKVNLHQKDWVAERLQKRYGGNFIQVWRLLLGAEYEHALQILIEADNMFDIASSNWLMLQDSFNDAVIRQFITYLQQRRLPGGTQTTKQNGQLKQYGFLIKTNGQFSNAFPIISANLLKFHTRRNTLPGSHPYDQKGGTQNRWLKNSERDVMLIDVGVALRDVATFVSNHP